MKRSQARTSAASLIATIAGLIVLYILFLPAEERAKLLDDNPSPSTWSGGSYHPSTTLGKVSTNETIFRTSPGKIYYQKLDEYEYDLSAFTLFKTTNAVVIENINNFRVRNGWFDKIPKNVTFSVDNLANTDNVMISFNTPRHSGTLTIKLNGIEIYQFDIDTQSPNPIALKKSYLKQGDNVLEFSVSGVGARFWSTNEYSFSDAKILGDVVDISRQESSNTFYISPEEGENLEKATLKFNPDCSTSQVGVLEVEINGRNVFSGIPDCGILNTYSISPSLINLGKNSINFKTDEGSYLIDQIQVKTMLKEPVQPTFYFELKDSWFKTKATERCGDVDGICPDDCSEDLDKDCCFEEYADGFWCVVKTDFVGDRCVGFVDENECGRCPSGYEDEDGNPPEACDNMCGDNTDDECPYDCSQNHDKDCCYRIDGDQYWCEDLPITGEDFRCMNELTTSTCQNCESGYKAEDTSFACPAVEEDKNELKSGIDVILIFRFTESTENKEAEVWINGKQTGFSTRESSYRKNIDNLVEPGTNSIRIRPKTDLDIRELEVTTD
jgi:hypothetical protein